MRKKIQKLLKNSPNSKGSIFIPSLKEFQIKKANYSKVKKKNKIVVSEANAKVEMPKLKIKDKSPI